MYPVFMAQLRKDKRKPLTLILFIVLSILATLIFGDSAWLTKTAVPIYSSEPALEEKWEVLLNNSEEIEFIVMEKEKAHDEVKKGKSDVAIEVMENDYRIIHSSSMPSVELVDQHVKKVFTEQAQLEAAGKNASDLKNDMIKVQVQSLNGGEIQAHNMGTQLLFGFTLFCAMFTIGIKVNGITSDKVSGIWNRLILSPVTKTGMYTGHLFYSFCAGFIQMVVVFLIFQYVFQYEFGSLPMILLIAAVYTISTVSMAMLLAGIAQTPEKFNMIYSSTIPIIPFICGVYMPPGTIDNPVLVFISDLFPLSHAVDAMLEVALFDAGWSEIALPIAFMLLIGVMCMGVGINLIERKKG